MKSLWDPNEASSCNDDPLALRVYTSRLLGRDSDLVLHGGGNTSVKATHTDRYFGDETDVIYVKGSGWDLATIEPEGFAPVKLRPLERLATLESLTDSEMVKLQRANMIDPTAPNPSVEAILHATIPFKFVDHTHADAVVTVSNSPDRERLIRELYGDRCLVVPYVMPGFVLAKQVYDRTKKMTAEDWNKYDGMILLRHGVFTFDDTARGSYEKMIDIVTRAERYLASKGARSLAVADDDAVGAGDKQKTPPPDPVQIARIRRAVCLATGRAVLAGLDLGAEAAALTSMEGVADAASRGPVTPDHSIRTKRIPAILPDDCDGDGLEDAVERYAKAYKAYFDRNRDGPHQTCLDPGPRWAVWPRHRCILSFGKTPKEVAIVSDIARHTAKCVRQAEEALGGWEALPEKDVFDVEYWELEQAKLKKPGGGGAPELRGKVALVTGAASGIGRACVEAFAEGGAAVLAVDVNPAVETTFSSSSLKGSVRGVVCDVTDADQIRSAVETAVRTYGGLDVLVSNAGTFPPSSRIADMPPQKWNDSLAVNLTGHQLVLKESIPYLVLGVDPAVVIVGSKNVAAPGPGVAAYSVAKAGLTQLGRVAALELGSDGGGRGRGDRRRGPVRVNVLHPNAVYDTGIWSDDVLRARADAYGMTVKEYKTNNVLKVEVTSDDVAALAVAMAGPSLFGKVTGAQLPIDGGNVRVI